MTEDHRNAPAGKPGHGPVKECPWCRHTGPPSSFPTYSPAEKLPAGRRSKAETSAEDSDDGGESVSADDLSSKDVGALASVACSLLMIVLWAARLARPDLLRVVNHLATKVTKWTSSCDTTMHRLMGYIQATVHLSMAGWVGDFRKPFSPFLSGCGV